MLGGEPTPSFAVTSVRRSRACLLRAGTGWAYDVDDAVRGIAGWAVEFQVVASGQGQEELAGGVGFDALDGAADLDVSG